MAYITTPPDVLNGNKVRTEQDEALVHTPVMLVGDRFDPTLQQSVDNRGAAKIAFNNGEPDFTIFGRTTVTESNLMGVYKFYERDYDFYFHKEEEVNGTVTRDAVNYCQKLFVTTEAGSVSGYYSNRFYQYRPGNTMPLIFTFKAGDLGKANLERRIGWFGHDEEIRMCFLLDETGICVELYDPLVGTNVVVPRSQWNGDKLNGLGGDENLSGATWDGTKDNIYWIDFQFLGAGAVRYGTWVDGKKVVLHTIGNYNQLDRPYVSEARFAFGAEQRNTGITSSDSTMHLFCTVIQNDGYDEFDRTTSAISNVVELTTTDFVPIISYRPTETKNGITNRNRLVPMINCVLNEGTVGIEVVAEIGTGLVNATWSESIDGIQYDIAADGILYNGIRKAGNFVSAGYSETTDLSKLFPIQTTGITRHFLPATSDHVTVLGRLVKQGGSDTSTCCVSVVITEVE